MFVLLLLASAENVYETNVYVTAAVYHTLLPKHGNSDVFCFYDGKYAVSDVENSENGLELFVTTSSARERGFSTFF